MGELTVPGWRRAARRLAADRFIHLSFATWLVLAIQTAFLALYLANNPLAGLMPLWERAAFVATNYAVTIVYFQVIGLAFRRLPLALRLANLVSIVALAVLFAWRYVTGVMLDFWMLIDNVRYMLYRETYATMLAQSSVGAFVALGAFVAAMIVVAAGTRLLARWPRPAHGRATLAASVLALLGLFAAPIYSYNELSMLSRTAFDYFCARRDCPPGFPYVVQDGQESWRAWPHREGLLLAEPTGPDAPPPAGPRPHIFLVLIESFNANFVGTANESGIEYTPFFNALRDRGLCVEHFYGNSIQTCRGQFAALCSVPPSYRRKVSQRNPPVPLTSLPAILAREGYRTLFFQAYRHLDFDNAGPFMEHIGFDTVKAMNEEFLAPDDEPYLWGWGLRDDRMYQKVFAYLDGQYDRGAASADRPVFVTLATITNHMGFNDMPRELKKLYPDPADRTNQRYANSVHLADEFLREFFVQLDRRPWLADSIVIVTGDHSFPAGEHGNFHNENLAYEESFRTPFVMLWEGRLAPRRLQRTAYSQLDIAPTLLDLLDIRARHHFRGESMLRQPPTPQPIPLIQPFGGVYLGTVIWPMKLVQLRMNGRQWLYDLQADPREEHNLIDSYDDAEMLRRLRDGIRQIELNQALLELRRIWPGEQ